MMKNTSPKYPFDKEDIINLIKEQELLNQIVELHNRRSVTFRILGTEALMSQQEAFKAMNKRFWEIERGYIDNWKRSKWSE